MRTSTPEFEESDDEAMSLSMNLYCNLKSIQNKVQRYEDPKMRLELILLIHLTFIN